MIDNIFIKDKNDYIKYSELKPRYKYSRKKVKFICTKCNCISEKTFVCLTTQAEFFKEKSKQTCIEKYGTENAILNYDIFVKSKQKYYYDERYFDSSWELAYYIWLKDNNIDFEYQPDIKFKYIYNNEIHYYHPDFKIDNKLQEIKGNLFFENNNINEKMICPFNRQLDDLYESKHQCMIANNVQILTENDIKEYIIYVKLNYGINFLKNCKIQKNYKKG